MEKKETSHSLAPKPVKSVPCVIERETVIILHLPTTLSPYGVYK